MHIQIIIQRRVIKVLEFWIPSSPHNHIHTQTHIHKCLTVLFRLCLMFMRFVCYEHRDSTSKAHIKMQWHYWKQIIVYYHLLIIFYYFFLFESRISLYLNSYIHFLICAHECVRKTRHSPNIYVTYIEFLTAPPDPNLWYIIYLIYYWNSNSVIIEIIIPDTFRQSITVNEEGHAPQNR